MEHDRQSAITARSNFTSRTHRTSAVVTQIHCCICGLFVDANPANMCPSCLRAHVDITESLEKDYIMIYCPECERYLQPPQYWSRADLESRELMTICLKRIKGLNNASKNRNEGSTIAGLIGGAGAGSGKAKLIDAKFIWTEPHSKQLKVKITIQKEIFNNIIIQQSCLIFYKVQWQMCTTCQRVATGQPQWDACVQLRQKVSHKRTFLYIEQLILKKRIHESFIRVQAERDGLDFYFGHKSHALNFIEFIGKNAPSSRKDAVQLVSHDSKSNTAIQHHTFSIEISPLCREDLVLIPYKDYYLKHLGGMGPLVLVYKVYSSVVFLDPRTLRAGEINAALYWKKPFNILMNSREMRVFYVLNCELQPVTNGKYQMGLVTVCMESEVGEGREWIVQSHLGGLLNPGDLVMGYLLEEKNFNNEDMEEKRYEPEQLQDVVLVRKYFPTQRTQRNRRVWKLKKLDVVTAQGDATTVAAGTRRQDGGGRTGTSATAAAAVAASSGIGAHYDDELEFEDEVERDSELRKDIAVYKLQESELEARRFRAPTTAGGAATAAAAAPTAEGADIDIVDDDEDNNHDDDRPHIALEEMLNELAIEDEEEAAEGFGGPAIREGHGGDDDDDDDCNEEDPGYNKKKRIE